MKTQVKAACNHSIEKAAKAALDSMNTETKAAFRKLKEWFIELFIEFF